MSNATRRRAWSEDELRVLAAVYFNADFSVGDDQRAECRTIADCFARTPGSIDRQWRNLNAVVQGQDEGLNIGKRVKLAARDYLQDPAGHRELALDICRQRSWPLQDLILFGRQSDGNRPVINDSEADQVVRSLHAFCRHLEFKLFPSGGQGFHHTGFIRSGNLQFEATVSAVVAGSNLDPHVSVHTTQSEIVEAVRGLLTNATRYVFPTGRVGYWVQGEVSVPPHQYRVTIQAAERRRES